ncbi:helix-turn-helix domain-containing protein [Lentzea flaviverrucosa]|uniref:Helix-turn-helix domain-containing protein n=1 Tax=Lentzea flaviverrucosa TaxID=200379 RepID=A0A1H9XU04_9PSEU|nr:helix-turn-helix transcriptional regulator [Lentzea flaviverrucosa]RDI18885.1 helix-turn-helix protein [Lentzea flaviverrucosa]SES49652.1 Helix-turn-helix domain-containing protein [Lentzea flaviverrucosa]
MPRRKSSVVGREFGDAVRKIIEPTGLTHRKIAEELGWDEAKLSDLVRGKGGVTEADLMQLLGFCRVKPPEVQRLLALFRETRVRGYLKFPNDQVPALLEQERLANEITVWSSLLVPGHLQTTDYMRAAIDGVVHPAAVDYEEVITAKIERHKLFHWSRTFAFYIHEYALRLPVGGPDVMKDQYIHLLGMAQRSYITLRIVPASIGAHAGVSGSFIRLGYEKFEPVVFLEGENSGLILEDTASLAVYASVVERLDDQALNPEESKELITGFLT